MYIGNERSGARFVATSLSAVFAGIFLLACGDEGSGTKAPLTMVQPATEASSTSSGINQVPIIDRLEIRPSRPIPGRHIQATAIVSDPNGDPTTVRFVWQTKRGKLLGEGNTLDTTGLYSGDRIELLATATDGVGESATVGHSFRLEHPSAAISLVTIDQSEGTKPGVRLGAVIELIDDTAGAAELLLEWKVNGESVGTDDELDTTSFAPGDIVILRARLEGNDVMRRTVASSPVILSRGDAPEIFSTPLAGIEGGQFRYQIGARSPIASAKLTYALITGPDGMTVDEPSGLVRWQPGSDQYGRFTIEVSATDQWGSGVAQSFVIESAAPTAPAAPAP